MVGRGWGACRMVGWIRTWRELRREQAALAGELVRLHGAAAHEVVREAMIATAQRQDWSQNAHWCRVGRLVAKRLVQPGQRADHAGPGILVGF